MDEADLLNHVARELRRRFGPAVITREPRLQETNREPDFVVDLEFVRLYMEGENQPADVTAGAGQALLYAAHDPRGVPVSAPPGVATAP